MKVRLNLTIEKEVLHAAKRYVSNSETSISELVENYLRAITAPEKRKTVIDIVKKLPAPVKLGKKDLQKDYMEERAGKYGF